MKMAYNKEKYISILNDGSIEVDELVNKVAGYLSQVIDMAKKKREHIVFDQMLKPQKSIPFSVVNKQDNKKKRKK